MFAVTYFSENLAITALIFLCAWMLFLILFTKRSKKKFQYPHLKNLDHTFFYYYNLQTKKEYISKSLKELLSLKNQQNQFKALLSCFLKKDQEPLKNLHDKLCNHNIDYSIKSMLRASILSKKAQDNVKHLGIMISTHIEKKDEIKEFYMHFADITKELSEIYYVEYKNQALQNDIHKKNQIINSIPHPIWARDRKDMKINYFNTKFSKIILNDPEKQETLEISKQEKSLAAKAKKSNSLVTEDRHLVIDGTRYLYNFQETNSEDKSLIVGLGLNITNQEKLKTELNRHISAQSDLLESTASAIAIYGQDTKIRFFNNAFIKLWELDEKWLATRPTYATILEKLRNERKLPEQRNFQEFKNEQLELFTDLMPSTHNDFFYLPDGRSLRVIVIQHAFGGLLFSYEDMTDRLALESSFKTLIAVQKETIDNLNEGIIVLSESGKLEISNSKFNNMWNLEKNKLKPKSHIIDILQMMHPLARKEQAWELFRENFISRINRRKTDSMILNRDDDSVIDVLFVPLPDGATLVSYQDITDSTLVEMTLRDRNKALQETDKLKTEFLANISYELRSPLTSITGFSEALKKKYFGDLNEHQEDYISSITNSANHLAGLINDILDLASIDAGYMQLETESFDVYKKISSLSDTLTEKAKQHNYKFNFNCPKDIGNIKGDPLRIRQVILKLVTNSVENSKNNDAEIYLRIEKSIEEKSIKFIVQDNGPPITNADTKNYNIFDKFPSITIKNQNKRYKAALGLSLAKSFIEMHKGYVTVESSDQGNIFTCVIPTSNTVLLQKNKKKPLHINSANTRQIENRVSL